LAAPTESAALADIVRAYEDQKEGLLTSLEGTFCIAIVDLIAHSVLIASDRMGIERLVYAEADDGLVFGSSASAVSAFPDVGRQLRDQALYDFLFIHMVPTPETIYQGILKLPPASLLIQQDGRRRVRRYWQPSYDYLHDFEEAKAALKAALNSAVSESGSGAGTGAFLSGGLDSSTVAGVLTTQSRGRVKTFSVGFGVEAFDELAYARAASKHFRTDAHEYEVKARDIVDVFLRIAEYYDEPFGNSSAVPTYYCAKLAADNGVSHLLAGDGGDELFGGNERYAKQQIFEFYQRIPHWMRRGLVEPALRPLSPNRGLVPLRKLKSYVDQASVPLPDRFETWNFVFREDHSRLLDSDFAAAIDAERPLEVMRRVWDAAPTDQILERMLWYDWHFTLADNDLRKVGKMCELAGVRVSFPMLHPAVVTLSTRIPPKMKMAGLELRTFFRRAMADFLPREVLEKKKHGFGLPFGLWLKTDEKLADLIYSLLSDLRARRIVSSVFLTNLIDEHRKGDDSYYGYLIWDLAMLEGWLATHDVARSAITSRRPDSAIAGLL
jgi:asparagine synthase (glutamine-hydrolysing)